MTEAEWSSRYEAFKTHASRCRTCMDLGPLCPMHRKALDELEKARHEINARIAQEQAHDKWVQNRARAEAIIDEAWWVNR